MEKVDFYKKSSEFLKAMANPTRLELIDLLVQGRRSVESVATALDLNIKTVSSYLAELYRVNILKREKEGKQVFYFIEDKEFLSFFLSMRNLVDRKILLKEQVDTSSLKDVIRLAKHKKITLLDTRPELEFNQGHLPKSKSILLALKLIA